LHRGVLAAPPRVVVGDARLETAPVTSCKGTHGEGNMMRKGFVMKKRKKQTNFSQKN
jgi:hypothetical protein